MDEIGRLQEKFERLENQFHETNLRLERNTVTTEENTKTVARFMEENARAMDRNAEVMEKFGDTLTSVKLAMEQIACSNRMTEKRVDEINENMKEVEKKIADVDNKSKVDLTQTATKGFDEWFKKGIIALLGFIFGGGAINLLNNIK